MWRLRSKCSHHHGFRACCFDSARAQPRCGHEPRPSSRVAAADQLLTAAARDCLVTVLLVNRLVTDADGRTEEVRAEAVAAAQQEESLKAAIAEKEADMAAAAAEKELQAGGEVRELQAATDKQSKQCADATLSCNVVWRASRGVVRANGAHVEVRLPGRQACRCRHVPVPYTEWP